MASHVLDMATLRNSFGAPRMRGIWDEKNRLQCQLDAEKALALAEGELGLIPKEAAEKIASAANADLFDPEELIRLGQTAQHSLMPTIMILQKLSEEAGEYVHYGVTTQDIVDTGTMLQLKQADELIRADVKEVLKLLYQLTDKYKATPMAGRSHGIQGLPITFGYKLAVFLSELSRNWERLEECHKRVFVGGMSGAVGTYASFGPKGPEVERRALAILGLGAPEICWQASRDRFSEYAEVALLISGTLGRLGNELYNLMRTEFGEVEEPFSKGKIGSSTMPHKRNPASIEGLASLTRPVFHAAALIHESLMMEHERDAMSWRAEWIGIPELCQYLSCQLVLAKKILDGLVVKPERMLKNLNMMGGLIVSERVMFVLGEKIGKQTAHHLVYELSMQSEETGESFAELLASNETVRQYLNEEEIAELLNPEHYTGSSIEKAEEVLANFRAKKILSEAELYG